MEVLLKYGNSEQRSKWLKPLLEGKIRSCFAMTEPAVASSDATNIQASIEEKSDHYLINAHKWWISGRFCIFKLRSDNKNLFMKCSKCKPVGFTEV